jgi:hypothetical protein
VIRFLADEDLDNDILRGLKRRVPDAVISRVQDLFPGKPDPEVLAWCADDGSVLVSHDVQTMRKHAYARIDAELRMPGLILIPRSTPIHIAIDDLALIAEASLESDWEGKVSFLPL